MKEEKLETPYFLLHEEKLERNILELKAALKVYWNNYEIGYSCKTNSTPWIMKYMKKYDIKMEVVSDNEYLLAEKVGYKNKEIIFNGPNKGKRIFKRALLNGSYINIDSLNEIEWLEEIDSNLLEEVEIGIRVNFDLEKYCPNETAYLKDGSRFGFSYENGDVLKVIERVNKLNNIKIKGLHIHNTTKTRSIRAYESICKCACKIAINLNYTLKYIDIGGGFFGGVPGKTTFNEYLERISTVLKTTFEISKTKLIIEPGSALIGSPIDFVCEVIDVKDTFAKRIVTVNGSRNLIDPFFMKNSYFYNLVIKDDRKIKKEQIICGYTCLDNDRLMRLENNQELKRGDIIIFEKVGSYTITLSPLFIEYFPTIYVKKKDNEIICVREKWSIEEFLQKQIF